MVVQRDYDNDILTVRAHFPTAMEVYVLGEFNNWSTTATPLRRLGRGLFEGLVPLKSSRRPNAEEALGAADEEQEPAAPLAEPDICFFVWEYGQRIGRLVHDEFRELRGLGSPTAPAGPLPA